jgi:hypothetical protein
LNGVCAPSATRVVQGFTTGKGGLLWSLSQRKQSRFGRLSDFRLFHGPNIQETFDFAVPKIDLLFISTDDRPFGLFDTILILYLESVRT